MTSRLLTLAIASTAFISSISLAEPAKMTTEQQQSYALGVQTAKSFQSHGMHIDIESYMQGMTDVQNKSPLKMTDAQIIQTLSNLQKEQTEKVQQQRQSLAKTNLAASEAFLEENAAKPGIKTLDSGIQYQVITEGTGPKPSISDTVTVHYEGKLINGTVFDSSYKRNEPATFPLNGVIPGWQKALTQMPVGSTWIITIPPSLAYGEQGTPDGSIGPNQALIFKVNLIKIAN